MQPVVGATGTVIAVSTMSRALRLIGARCGRPRPVVLCPLSSRQRRRRLAALREVVAGLADDEVLVYEDEVDIHLNPKIGTDWMPHGLTRQVVTPGENRKEHPAGALDLRTHHLLVVEGGRKTSRLVLDLFEALLRRHPGARRIHVVLDNYVIHTSRRSQTWMRDRGGRIQLRFLPPYCPNENPIERVWLDLHANVTRNHPRRNVGRLLHNVR